MIAEIAINTKVEISEIKIGDRTLDDLLSLIEDNIRTVITDISFQSQKDCPNYEDIDAPLHEILNILEGN